VPVGVDAADVNDSGALVDGAPLEREPVLDSWPRESGGRARRERLLAVDLVSPQRRELCPQDIDAAVEFAPFRRHFALLPLRQLVRERREPVVKPSPARRHIPFAPLELDQLDRDSIQIGEFGRSGHSEPRIGRNRAELEHS
jgi:hypothetical protein